MEFFIVGKDFFIIFEKRIAGVAGKAGHGDLEKENIAVWDIFRQHPRVFVEKKFWGSIFGHKRRIYALIIAILAFL